MDKKIFKISFDIKKIKFKLPRLKQGKRFGLSQNKDRDWKIILWTVFVIVLIISGLSYSLFVKVNSGIFFRDPELNGAEAKTINRIQLREVVGSIEELQIKFEDSRVNSPVTSDPAR